MWENAPNGAKDFLFYRKNKKVISPTITKSISINSINESDLEQNSQETQNTEDQTTAEQKEDFYPSEEEENYQL